MKLFALLFLFTVLFATAAFCRSSKVSPLFEQYIVRGGQADIEAMIKVKTPGILTTGGKNSLINKRNIAGSTQDQLIVTIKEMYSEMTGGQELEYKTFWIANAVYAKITEPMIEKIAELPEVESILPNLEFHLINPIPSQSGPENFRAADAYNLERMGVQRIWQELGIDGSGVKVGVVDSGLNTNLGFTDGKFVAGKSFVGDTVTDDVTDKNGHGTHVSGTVIGGHVSGKLYAMSLFWPSVVGDFDGCIGVAPGAKLYFAKVMGDDGSGSFDDIMEGMQWMVDPDGNPATKDGVQVINASLGADESVPELRPYIKEIVDTGTILVVAAGNSGKKVGSPADFPECISIGATDSSDKKASFSSIGPSEFDGVTYIKPDVCAPGVKVVSYYKDKLMQMDGTSMASPNACGVVALIMQANPGLDREQVREILKSTALDLGTAGPDNSYGWGRIDAYKAVKAAAGSQNPLYAQIRTFAQLEKDAILALNSAASDTEFITHADARNAYLVKISEYLTAHGLTIDDLIQFIDDLADDDGPDDLEPLLSALKELKELLQQMACAQNLCNG
ncbi:MAG: S8 family serine peptidase [Candidatus Wallbacteria bacterium]|nr:S8 family serine peptidase [Candidatus Wallbacteria bacterium]